VQQAAEAAVLDPALQALLAGLPPGWQQVRMLTSKECGM
jgi:hypothetical protein